MNANLSRAVITLAIVLAIPVQVLARDTLPTILPAEAGFSAQRLERYDNMMKRLVDEEELYGAVNIATRHGRIFYYKALGMRDEEAGKPMQKDTIFRIYSMTKPVIGVAMMILYEEGKWRLNDPVSKFIPEFGDLKVYAGEDKNAELVLEDPDHAPTMRELMIHTAGFSYGVFGQTPVDKMYRDKDVLDPDSSLEAMIDKLSGIPLLYQPGTRWVYSVSADIQGYLVQKLSGQSLPEFLEEHIFRPLDMKDTGFYVPRDKQDRFAQLYGYDRKKQALHPTPGDEFGAGDYAHPPGLPSGGAGLVSTARDYLRFCQMLLNGGRLGDIRILAPATVDLMRVDHLPRGLEIFPGTGFGLDFAVTKDPARVGTLTGKNTYYWAGAAGTWFWIDPVYDIVLVGMIQRMGAGAPGSPLDIRHLSVTALYQALVKPEQ